MSAEHQPLVVPQSSDGAPAGAPPPHNQRPRALSVQQMPQRKTGSSYGSVRSKLGRGLRSFQQSLQQSGKFQDSSFYYDVPIEPPTPLDEGEPGAQPTKLSCKVLFARYFFTILIFLFVLVFSALSKVCFANIAAQLNANTSRSDDGEKRRSVAFVQLVLVLCVPQAVTILKTSLLGILGKTTKHFPWPTWAALIKGGFVAVAEAACLSAFTMFVATQADPATTILLIPGVYAFTALSSVCSERVRRILRPCCRPPREGQGNSTASQTAANARMSCWRSFRKKLAIVLDSEISKSIALVLQIIGLLAAALALFSYPTSKTGPTDVHGPTIFVLVSIPICGLVLSFLWSSMVQSAIFKSEPQQNADQYATDQRCESRPAYPGSYKGGFVYACIRLLFIPFLCYGLITALERSPDMRIDVAIGFTDWTSRDHLVFFLQVFGALLAVFFSLVALWSTFQPWAFTLPLLLSTPIAIVWFWIQHGAGLPNFPFGDVRPSAEYIYYLNGTEALSIIVPCLLICLWLGEILCLGAQIWKKPTIPVARENTLYLSPAYDGVFLDSFLLLNRYSAQRLHLQSTEMKNVAEQSRTSTVFICSTMFREAEHEMRQMLKSIHRVAQLAASDEQSNTAQFESHVFFDGAVASDQCQEFSLQLLSLLERTLKVSLGDMRKYKTPYGYQLHWMVENTLPFYVHFKDNSKVKNKKRWSQVMYMNYIIEHRLKETNENGELKHNPKSTYILTTDADIDFTPDSVAALLDFLVRDDSVGAVCARTHPLGSGPLVWYQIFEYAFGHWFQKSAEHVLGCVLCCPGCFSVFRVSAISEVIKTYQSSVTSAGEFLTKDMGEDRWLCTLMIQKGWRLEYAALPQNSTYCPESFNEFFNQRRRWVPSTLANLLQLITTSGVVTSGNDSISYLFIIYQLIIIFSTAISPATVILVISSGLSATSLQVSEAVSIAILSTVTILYVIICLWTPEKVQLLVGKVLSFFMAIAIAVAIVGIMVDAVTTVIELIERSGNQTQIDEYLRDEGLPLDATYLLGFALIILTAGVLHLTEFKVLIHFIWYIIGIPSGYLLLIIYSACNLHNRSWGTRVGITETSGSESKLVAVYNDVMGVLFDLWSAFVSCLKRKKGKTAPPDPPPTDTPEVDVEAGHPGVLIEEAPMKKDLRRWLKVDMDCDQDYISKFEDNGYTQFEFLDGMTLKDLKEIGIDRRGYQLRLFREIRRNPSIPSWQENRIPTSVPSFLGFLKLSEYEPLFKSEGYFTLDDVENLIGLNETHLRKMGITKKAHLKQLMKGLKRLQYPTYRDMKIRKAKREVEKAATIPLDELEDRKGESEFWSKMVDPKTGILRPESAQFDGNTDDFKEKLKALRNHVVLALVFINIMWMALILVIQSLPILEEAAYLEDSPFSAVFLGSYFIVIIIQFAALFLHRMETLLHVVARTNLPQKVRGHWFNPLATIVVESSQDT